MLQNIYIYKMYKKYPNRYNIKFCLNPTGPRGCYDKCGIVQGRGSLLAPNCTEFDSTGNRKSAYDYPEFDPRLPYDLEGERREGFRFPVDLGLDQADNEAEAAAHSSSITQNAMLGCVIAVILFAGALLFWFLKKRSRRDAARNAVSSFFSRGKEQAILLRHLSSYLNFIESFQFATASLRARETVREESGSRVIQRVQPSSIRSLPSSREVKGRQFC